MTELIIRTSDRNQFRKCRLAWDYGSKIRLNYMPASPIEPLDFGSAIHDAMQVLYDPKRWHDEDRSLVLVEAHAAFMRWMVKWKKQLVKLNQWDAYKDRHAELIVLGKSMIDFYVTWVAEGPKGNRDKNWEPIFTEIEFEIPIPVSEKNRDIVRNGPRSFTYNRLLRDGEFTRGDYLHKADGNGGSHPILYQGRIDLVILDLQTEKNWIIDHKTAAQFMDQTSWVDKDTQTRSYGWACKQVLGIDIEGVMFNRLRKKVPDKPQVLASGALSKNKSQTTTPELYRAEIKKRGLDPAQYADFLSYFEGQTYVERLSSIHSREAYEQTERAILMEAMDMLGNPFIYPSPDMFSCNYCSFRAPCSAYHDGLDDHWVLNHSGGFVNRSTVGEIK